MDLLPPDMRECPLCGDVHDMSHRILEHYPMCDCCEAILSE